MCLPLLICGRLWPGAVSEGGGPGHACSRRLHHAGLLSARARWCDLSMFSRASDMFPHCAAHTMTRARVRAFTHRRRRRGGQRPHQEATARMPSLNTPSQTSLVQTPRKRIARPKARERKGVAMTARQVGNLVYDATHPSIFCLLGLVSAFLGVWSRLVDDATHPSISAHS